MRGSSVRTTSLPLCARVEHGVRGSWCLLILLVVASGCQERSEAASSQPLRLATSHSLEESGLFQRLAPMFREATGIDVKPAFVGTGRALALGRSQQADVVWVHSRPQEDAFVDAGYGINRHEIMFSEYVIVGPAEDPAGTAKLDSAVEALRRIAQASAPFVSRGDGSGNHTRETALWKLAGIKPKAPWYTSQKQGMLAVLEVASKGGGYALTDQPTFLVHKRQLKLVVLVRGDGRLENPYSVIAVNPAKVQGVNYAGAIAFIDFVTGSAAQTTIGDFGKDRYGVPLFQPLAPAKAR